MPDYNESYTLEEAAKYIGKRVIVSLRHIDSDGNESFSGLWGIIDSVHDGGLLMKVEGGITAEYWMLPPNFESLLPAKYKFYQFNDGVVVQNVDYEAYFSTSRSIEGLENRS